MKKNIIIIILFILVLGLSGYLVFDKVLINNENEFKEEQDNTNDFKEVNDSLTKERFAKLSLIYTDSLDVLNNEYSCENSNIDVDCIGIEKILSIVLSKMKYDNMLTTIRFDDNSYDTTYFADFSIIKEYASKMFGMDIFDFPEGNELGNSYCPIYVKKDNGYEIIKNGPKCSFGSHGTVNDKWAFSERIYNVSEDSIYVDIPYFYVYGENEFNYDDKTEYCIDDTKNDCVSSISQLDKSKLVKVRYLFDYKDDKLVFNSIQIFNR